MVLNWLNKKALLKSLIVLPFCFILDDLGILQHNLLASEPYIRPGDHADTAIVLGYALKRDGSPTAPLRQRVESGVSLFTMEVVDNVIFSGGHPGGGIRGQSEAQAMLTYAESLTSESYGDRWVKEDRSTSTRTNAINSLAIVQKQRWKSVVIVTSSFHQIRSRLTFQCAIQELFPDDERPELWMGEVEDNAAQGYQILYEPFIKQYNFFRELLAIAWYWYNGWLC